MSCLHDYYCFVIQKASERGEPIEGEPGSFQTSATGAGWITHANGLSHGTVYRRNVYMEASRPGDKITYCLVKKGARRQKCAKTSL